MVKEKGLGKAILILLAASTIVTVGVWYLLQPEEEVVAQDFSLTDLDGNTFRLSDFRGKVVVLDFMATWCGPCQQQMSQDKVVWEKYRDKIIIISIGVDPSEPEGTLRDFAQRFSYATWIWAKDTANLAEAYGVTVIPKTVIIDQEGHIRYSHTGLVNASTLTQEIKELLE